MNAVLFVRSHSFAMSLFREHLYYTDARTHVVKRLNKYTGGEPLEVNIKPNTKVPVALKVVHPLNQPMTRPSGEICCFLFHFSQTSCFNNRHCFKQAVMSRVASV